MDDPDFTHKLFRENNELRVRCNTLHRELFNKTAFSDSVEEELRQLKLRIENNDLQSVPSNSNSTQAAKKVQKVVTENVGGNSNAATAKELQEALFALERRGVEMKQLKEDLIRVQSQLDEKTTALEQKEKEAQDLKTDVNLLQAFKINALREAENAQKKVEVVVPVDIQELKIELEAKEATIIALKKQTIDITMEASKKHNDQQNQLQGLEALLEGIRKEYEEFIEITKLENESFRKLHQTEYDELKATFEQHKATQFEEKKRLMNEYSNLLFSMQSQFEEYRVSAEYMFNTEILKLEEELSNQSLRYEHEIMYIIQAKDKFYTDMMVAKDAKIMNLIEGSDMQTLMQKHELDIENLRKDHAREIERVKSDQETEQKNLIALLQRQNVSLESKCEKLQAHLKTLELRIRELMGTIDSKVKQLADREEQRLKMESDFEVKLAEANARISALHQEKEHLRHKVIRLNLNAKGEGENSIENMLKRISRETTDLHDEFEQLSSRYDTLVGENQVLVRRLKEREKFAEFLEKEVARRTDEYTAMTRTFEEFLAARARQSAKERHHKLPKLATQSKGPFGNDPATPRSDYVNTPKGEQPSKKVGVVRTVIPAKGEHSTHDARVVAAKVQQQDDLSPHRIELERGYSYLKKFKMLSRAFASGDFRIIPSGHYQPTADNLTGPWQKTALYGKLDDANLAMARLYTEPEKDLWDTTSKPQMYPIDEKEPKIGPEPAEVIKFYEDKLAKSLPPSRGQLESAAATHSKVQTAAMAKDLVVGGISALKSQQAQ